MSYQTGPRIVTNGLVFCVDAADANSYPGSGTTWTDLSGNGNNGTLNNGPTYSSSNKGYISFDGTNDWLNFSGYRPNFTYSAGINFSFEVWFYLASNTYGMALSSERNLASGWVWAVRSINNNLIYSWWRGNVWDDLNSLASQIIPSNRWNLGNLVYQASSNNLIFYLNGINIGSLSAGTIFDATGDFSIIGWDNGNSIFGNPQQISRFCIYNRALSATEVLQNYNATKGRYGF